MNTNDPQAPYGHCSGCTDPHSEGTHCMGTIEHPLPAGPFLSKPTEIASLLSEEEMVALTGIPWNSNTGWGHILYTPDMKVVQRTIAAIQAKITGGDLIRREDVLTILRQHEANWGALHRVAPAAIAGCIASIEKFKS